ncbi:MAG: hypothetical protein AAFP03_19145 [Cyanobacteria bacterium J06598_3]
MFPQPLVVVIGQQVIAPGAVEKSSRLTSEPFYHMPIVDASGSTFTFGTDPHPRQFNNNLIPQIACNPVMIESQL